jgi:hypothetical protein
MVASNQTKPNLKINYLQKNISVNSISVDTVGLEWIRNFATNNFFRISRNFVEIRNFADQYRKIAQNFAKHVNLVA